MNRKEKIYDQLKKLNQPVSAKQLAEELGIDRANVSRELNRLFAEGRVLKQGKKPVLFMISNQKVKNSLYK